MVARPLRIEYPGAFYHVTARGNEQKDIFKSGRDREKFFSYLESAWERYGAVFHAYCLMSNHYHLMLETPQGNLSRIMKHINSSYTTYFNIRQNRAGHLFQGRYKSILIEADAYAAELSRYIHLNPVKAKMTEAPEGYPWSSYHYYIEGSEPPWLRTDFVRGYFGRKEQDSRRNYKSYVLEMVGREYPDPLAGAVASTILGSDEFVSEVQEKRLEGKDADRDLPVLRELAEKPCLDRIRKVAEEAFPEDVGLGRKAGIYLCHRYSGAKLKEIGELFLLSESGVTQASRRFEKEMERDRSLEKRVAALGSSLGSGLHV